MTVATKQVSHAIDTNHQPENAYRQAILDKSRGNPRSNGDRLFRAQRLFALRLAYFLDRQPDDRTAHPEKILGQFLIEKQQRILQQLGINLVRLPTRILLLRGLVNLLEEVIQRRYRYLQHAPVKSRRLKVQRRERLLQLAHVQRPHHRLKRHRRPQDIQRGLHREVQQVHSRRLILGNHLVADVDADSGHLAGQRAELLLNVRRRRQVLVQQLAKDVAAPSNEWPQLGARLVVRGDEPGELAPGAEIDEAGLLVRGAGDDELLHQVRRRPYLGRGGPEQRTEEVMVVSQGAQVVLVDNVFLEELPVVVGHGSCYEVSDVILASEMLEALDRQSQELDEDVEAAVFMF